jgi:threonine dehydrogenase-like Zn-dependent dehydrogenase
VRVVGCGVCASNVPPFEGRDWFEYPMPPGQPGHEAWGVVEQLGPGVDALNVGDRVAMLSDHGYASHDIAEVTKVVRLPDDLTGPLPGEPLGCVMNIHRRALNGLDAAGLCVAVVGVGFLGALLTQLITRRHGLEVTAISRRAASLEVAASVGAAQTLDWDRAWAVAGEVGGMFGGGRFDVVIECTGKQEALDLCTELVAERGRLVIAGFHQDGMRQVNMQTWNWRGLDVINAHERDEAVYVQGIRDAVEAVRVGDLDPTPLYTHHLPLDRLQEALELTRDRPDGFVKALVYPGGVP